MKKEVRAQSVRDKETVVRAQSVRDKETVIRAQSVKRDKESDPGQRTGLPVYAKRQAQVKG